MIIGLTGQAGSGKDTVAQFIAKDANYCIISLADKIKKILYKEFGFTKEQLWGPSGKRLDPHKFLKRNDGTPLNARYGANTLGTQWGRDLIHEDVWVEFTLHQIKIIQNDIKNGYCGRYTPCDGWESGIYSYKHFIIPDIRYLNELLTLKNKAKAKIIRIIRPGAELTGEYALHSSATEMLTFDEKDIDYTIYNNGTLEELEEKAANIIALIMRNDKQ